MKDAKQIGEELADIYKALKDLGERSAVLKHEADQLRDVVHEGGYGQLAMSDAGGLHHHIDWLTGQIESASIRAQSAFDYAEESKALRAIPVPS